ncbi:hypothetical protein EPN44_15020 [bacterium]|nr:MAG: hypothetical protein EPN44_15020 [bacterium]
MEHAAFADLSNLQLVLTRFVYEDRAALPLSWRCALGFRRMLALAQGDPRREPPASARPPAPRVPDGGAPSLVAERRDSGSCGASMRVRELAGIGDGAAPSAVRRPVPAKASIAALVTAAVREGRGLCTLDLSAEGLGRVQIFVRARGARIDCAVLCSREARPSVERGFVQARELLARSGMILVAAPYGEAS